jgi:hypothetical protein
LKKWLIINLLVVGLVILITHNFFLFFFSVLKIEKIVSIYDFFVMSRHVEFSFRAGPERAGEFAHLANRQFLSLAQPSPAQPTERPRLTRVADLCRRLPPRKFPNPPPTSFTSSSSRCTIPREAASAAGEIVSFLPPRSPPLLRSHLNRHTLTSAATVRVSTR